MISLPQEAVFVSFLVVASAFLLSGGTVMGAGIVPLIWRDRGDAATAPLPDLSPVARATVLLAFLIPWAGFPGAAERLWAGAPIPLIIATAGMVLRESRGAFAGRRGEMMTGFGTIAATAGFGLLLASTASGGWGPGAPFEWWRPFPLACAALSTALFADLAAVRRFADCTESTPAAGDAKTGAVASGAVLATIGFFTPVVAIYDAPSFAELFFRDDASMALLVVTGGATVAGLTAILVGNRSLAWGMASVRGIAVVAGWATAQFPFALRPDLALADAATQSESSRALALLAAWIVVILLPIERASARKGAAPSVLDLSGER